jgi:hypothetical protein
MEVAGRLPSITAGASSAIANEWCSYSGPGADAARLIGHQLLLGCISPRVGFRPSGIDLLLQSFRQGERPRSVEAIAAQISGATVMQ